MLITNNLTKRHRDAFHNDTVLINEAPIVNSTNFSKDSVAIHLKLTYNSGGTMISNSGISAQQGHAKLQPGNTVIVRMILGDRTGSFPLLLR